MHLHQHTQSARLTSFTNRSFIAILYIIYNRILAYYDGTVYTALSRDVHNFKLINLTGFKVFAAAFSIFTSFKFREEFFAELMILADRTLSKSSESNTRSVQKVSDLWPGKIHLHAWRSATLIPFEVVSL